MFKAMLVEKAEDGGFRRSIVERSESDLPAGDLLVEVKFSSLNYKDALSATGNPGVTRNYPHTPGIDAAGVVVESATSDFAAGDEVIVIGYDLGMNTAGGFGQRIRVPAGWAVKRPKALDLRSSMVLGTAGFTAALCVRKLEAAGMNTGSGPILVTGATGGVGSVAVMLLAHLGYEVVAASGKPERADLLRRIGAATVIDRAELLEGSKRPLLKERWGGVVDTVGGEPMANAIKALKYGASLAACGLVAGGDFQSSVFPFILRNVNLLGVDSVELPLSEKRAVWDLLADDWRLSGLDAVTEELSLETLSAAIDRILAGKMVGRGLVDLYA